MRISRIIPVAVIFLLLLCTKPAAAQCPMCKANVESTIKGDGKKTGLGLNDGIIVLLSMPYIAFAVVGALWYRNSKRKNK